MDATEVQLVAHRGASGPDDALLLTALPSDVRQVFENNRAASLNSHLPAFQTCR